MHKEPDADGTGAYRKRITVYWHATNIAAGMTSETAGREPILSEEELRALCPEEAAGVVT
jgi:hypothetical protein